MAASETQAAAAIVILKRMIDAAENGNQAGEDAVVVAAVAPTLLAALAPFVADFTDAGVPASVPDNKKWQEVDGFSEFTVGDFRRAVAAIRTASAA